MRKLIPVAFVLMSITRLVSAQSGSVSINSDYSDWGATANVSGTYVDQSPGSYATVTNVSAQVVHARISWPSPGLTNYQPVSVQDPGGQRSSLANYYSWQMWGTDTIVIISYPLQPGETIFMVNGVAPSPAPSPSPTPVLGVPSPAVSLPSGYVLAFDEEFNEGSSFVTKWITNSPNLSAGGKTAPRWFTEKPVQGGIQYFFNSYGNNGIDAPYNVFTVDAENAGFPSGPAAAGPVGDGYLYFLGWHSDNRTSANDTTGDVSGLLSSLDYNGNGFKAAQGYWEAKIWLPPITTGSPPNAQGLWPGWWLLGADLINTDPKTEVDIMEAYSVDYTKYHTNLHRYNQSGASSPSATIQAPVDLSLGWHIYSVLITTGNVTFYLDGVQVSQFPSVPTDLAPMFCMVQFAFGGDWPDQNNWGTDPGNNQPWSNTTNMKVAYIRCWAVPGNF
jgi:hypothetical protein